MYRQDHEQSAGRRQARVAVTTTLAEVLTALQEICDDDQRIVSLVQGLVQTGRIRAAA